MFRRVEFAAYQPWNETAKRRADFMRASWKIFPDQADNSRFDAGDFGRDLEVIHSTIEAGTQIILPGDAEQVNRIHVLQPDTLQAPFHGLWNERRLAQLREGGNDDAALTASFGGLADNVVMELFDDLRHISPWPTS